MYFAHSNVAEHINSPVPVSILFTFSFLLGSYHVPTFMFISVSHGYLRFFLIVACRVVLCPIHRNSRLLKIMVSVVPTP
jgi:hypothetical protein